MFVHYGSSEFDIHKFRPVQNRLTGGLMSRHKPTGGLWGCPAGNSRGWIEFVLWNQLDRNVSKSFYFDIESSIYVIDTVKDLEWLIYRTNPGGRDIDFERCLELKIDAIWLTDIGERETRYTEPGLNGWDFESVLVLNPNVISIPSRQARGKEERMDSSNLGLVMA